MQTLKSGSSNSYLQSINKKRSIFNHTKRYNSTIDRGLHESGGNSKFSSNSNPYVRRELKTPMVS